MMFVCSLRRERKKGWNDGKDMNEMGKQHGSKEGR
jgi:hypothetical protein